MGKRGKTYFGMEIYHKVYMHSICKVHIFVRYKVLSGHLKFNFDTITQHETMIIQS